MNRRGHAATIPVGLVTSPSGLCGMQVGHRYSAGVAWSSEELQTAGSRGGAGCHKKVLYKGMSRDFPVGSVPTLFCLGIQPNPLNVHP